MFKINTESNRISRIETKRFSYLGFLERDHLQEGLANQPDSLCEELLITQKEFGGYNRDNSSEMIEWLVENMLKLEKAFKQLLQTVNSKLRTANLSTEENA